MSTAADAHRAQARANQDFADELLRDHAGSSSHVQWAVTATFYAAVHAMQAHLIACGHDPQSHQRREQLMADPLNKVPADVFRAYMTLSSYSKKSRYRCGIFAPSWVRQTLLDRHLKAIFDFVSL
ncbi:MAG: hypothetical protein IT306_23955 [Chloroflexi bacterium]|nr:hypothetical protein [Chloroflexota bacterium]